MQKNIVFVTASMKTGGGNRVFIELANELCSQMRVTIVCPNNSFEKHSFTIKKDICVKAIGTFASSKLFKLINILKCILYLRKMHKSDILIITDPFLSIFAFWLRKLNIYRFVQADDYTIFDDGLLLGKGIFFKLYKFLCKRSYNYKIKFIFNSKYTYEQFCKNTKYQVPCKIVHPSINHSIFLKRQDSLNMRRKIQICLIARRHPMKGLITFLKAYALLEEDIKRNIYVLLISHDDLSLFDLKDFKIIKPFSDEEISDIYNNSDIFISTSWWEGFGLPPLEAMACGCAVITSDSGGVNEYVKANRNCLMFEPKNEEELKNCIVLLYKDECLRKRIADQGMRDSLSFSWSKSASKLMEIIENDYSINSDI